MYTFKSAVYANEQNTAVVADTEENAHVLLSEVDTPDEWKALMESKVKISAFSEPDDIVPAPTKEELMEQLLIIQEQISNLKE